MKNIGLLIFSLLTLVSCFIMKNKTSVIWISGFRTPCEADAGKSNCLLVNKNDGLENDNWELFYSDIEGFEFEEGYLKKVKILEEKLSDDNLAADGSGIKYKLIKELEKHPENRTALVGAWKLEEFRGHLLSDPILPATLILNLQEMKIYGNGGCNTFKGTIQKLGLKSIVFSGLINTLKICPEENVEDQYLNSLSSADTYKIQNSKLNLFDNEGNNILTFKQQTRVDFKTKIHDIWSAIRIGGYPINKMVSLPRLEINTTDMKIYGNDGCNEYFGTVSNMTENTLEFDNIGTTRKMCENMEIPERYHSSIKKVSTFKFDNQMLILLDKEEKEVLAFLKTD